MIEVSREQYEMLLKGKWSGFVSMNVGGITTEYVVTEGYGKPDRFGNFSYFIEVGLATPAPPMTEPVGNLDEETSPLLQPSPRPKKVYVADLSNDLHDLFTGRLTHGNVYDAIAQDETRVVICTDEGNKLHASKTWFKEVYLYDEDETLLTCHDIEFQEGDYIDLRKHTPEQIRHIAEYYKFYDVEELLGDSYIFAVFDEVDFSGTNYTRTKGKEYTYDDIFYLEEL